MYLSSLLVHIRLDSYRTLAASAAMRASSRLEPRYAMKSPAASQTASDGAVTEDLLLTSPESAHTCARHLCASLCHSDSARRGAGLPQGFPVR